MHCTVWFTILPPGDMSGGTTSEPPAVSIPGMGPEDRVQGHSAIPGLDFQVLDCTLQLTVYLQCI